MHFWMFYAILSAQKFFHPKFFWVKQGTTQCYQAFLVSTKQFVLSCLSRNKSHNYYVNNKNQLFSTSTVMIFNWRNGQRFQQSYTAFSAAEEPFAAGIIQERTFPKQEFFVLEAKYLRTILWVNTRVLEMSLQVLWKSFHWDICCQTFEMNDETLLTWMNEIVQALTVRKIFSLGSIIIESPVTASILANEWRKR